VKLQQPAKTVLSGAFNQDIGLVKATAMITMLIDHVGAIFFPGVTELRIIGRIAFPLFCWGIVTGFERTRSWFRYALRLMAGGLIAQPFYMLALCHQWNEFNVMATLLLGLLSLAAMRERRWGSQIWGPLVCLLLAAAQQMDYGWRGVLLIQLMYLARTSRGGLAALMVSFCLYWGGSSSSVQSFLGLPLIPQASNQVAVALRMILSSFLRLQTLALLSLPFMLIPTRSGLKVPRWLSYAMYPGHLCLLWLIRLLVAG
jgi:hypothetical protein